MRFSIPSKTFLLGEYVALAGGPAILVSHAPCFEVDFLESSSAQIPFHPESPAGIWVDLHEELFTSVAIQFRDPYEGAGGFGASTAQFIAVYLYVLHKGGLLKNGLQLNDMQKWAIVEDYKNLFEDQDVPPSGYDVLSQLSGGIQIIEAQKQKISSGSWLFTDVAVSIYKTSQKIATHDHLNDLEVSERTLKELELCTRLSLEALQEQKKEEFFKAVKQFTQVQQKAGLLSVETSAIVESWSQKPGVLAVRGCGAMGADVVVVFKNKDTQLEIPPKFALRLVGDTLDFKAPGVQMISGSSKVQPS